MDGFPPGGHGVGFNGSGFPNYADFPNNDSYLNLSGGGETRDFMSQQPSFSSMLSAPSSSTTTASRLGLGLMDLNVGQRWIGMDTFHGNLQPGGHSGSSFQPGAQAGSSF
jgi:hypothetical protein